MRYAIYARHAQAGDREGLDSQILCCRHFIEQSEGEVVGIYEDDGQSGISLCRPAYETLLEHAQEGRFDFVVAETLDRLTRNVFAVPVITAAFKEAGVEWLFSDGSGDCPLPKIKFNADWHVKHKSKIRRIAPC